ncbi:hypothetical protein J6590_064501 [Homalodisca vitripennis]|nr:hypothetical protein J6590_064501 [Homalodisca vitripennis]
MDEARCKKHVTVLCDLEAVAVVYDRVNRSIWSRTLLNRADRKFCVARPDLGVCVAARRPDLGVCVAARRPDLGVCVAARPPDLGVWVAARRPDLGVCVAARRPNLGECVACEDQIWECVLRGDDQIWESVACEDQIWECVLRRDDRIWECVAMRRPDLGVCEVLQYFRVHGFKDRFIVPKWVQNSVPGKTKAFKNYVSFLLAQFNVGKFETASSICAWFGTAVAALPQEVSKLLSVTWVLNSVTIRTLLSNCIGEYPKEFRDTSMFCSFTVKSAASQQGFTRQEEGNIWTSSIGTIAESGRPPSCY